MTHTNTTLILNTTLAGLLAFGGWLVLGLPKSLTANATESATAEQSQKVDEKTIRELIKQLGDDSFDKREEADKQLAAIGEPALELLRQAAKDGPDAELRQRADQLARNISSGFLRLVRSFSGAKGNLPFAARVVVTPDGKKAIIANNDAFRCWEIESGKELLVFGAHKTTIWAMALSPDGSRLLAGGNDRLVRLYDVESGKQLQELKGHNETVWGAVFLPGGKQALTGAWDQSLRVWDLETGQQVRSFEGVRDHNRCLAVSPDGKTVAAGQFADMGNQHGAGIARLYDIGSGREIAAFSGHKEEIPNLAFSPDGKTLATCGYDKTLRLWDVATGKELRSMSGTPLHYFEFAEFTPDGSRIVSCGTEGAGTNFATRAWTVRVWEVASGKMLFESQKLNGGALGLAVLPNGHSCVTASRDGIARLWEWQR
jgi:WD40 repeat protein